MYSTYRDGISLRTLYRKAGNAIGPDVLIIKDEDGNVFGGFTTDSVWELRGAAAVHGRDWFVRIAHSSKPFRASCKAAFLRSSLPLLCLI
jgi:hypothetical protein